MRNQKGVVYLLVLLLAFPTVSYGTREGGNDDEVTLVQAERGQRQPGRIERMRAFCKEEPLTVTLYIIAGASLLTVGVVVTSIFAGPHTPKQKRCCDLCTENFVVQEKIQYCAPMTNGTAGPLVLHSCPFSAHNYGYEINLMCDVNACIEPSFPAIKMMNGSVYCNVTMAELAAMLGHASDEMPPLTTQN